MNKIALITDSACDISYDTAKKNNIGIIPLRINFSYKSFRDREEITPPELYSLLKEEIPKTSLPSAEDVQIVFKSIEKNDFDDIIYIGISSGLSGTYNFVKILGEEHFGNKFHSFDSKTLSGGEGLLVEKTSQMIKTGNTVSEIFEKLNEIRKRMYASFVVKDITYLSRGGRIGKVAGTIGSLLRICPIIRVNEDGVYETSAKSMGFSRSLQMMIKQVQDKFSGLKIIVQIVHGLEETAAKSVLDRIKQFSTVVEGAIVPVTAVLGVHTGHGLIGIIAYEV